MFNQWGGEIIEDIISDWVLGHLSGFALVCMDKMGWIQIYGVWKEGTDPMSEWMYLS
jgi:hypothetical protein